MLIELLEMNVNADRHQQRMLYGQVIASPDSSIRIPVLGRTRGRPTGSVAAIHLNL